jgi:cell division protein FtsB
LQSEQLSLANRVQRMSPATLDADLLDEQTRLMLNYARDDEVVIMRPESAPANEGLALPEGGLN